MSVLSFAEKMFPPPTIMSFPSVGVDVSDTTLKFIQFEADGDALGVKHWGEIAVPEGVVERGSVHDVSKLAEVLMEMKRQTKAEYVRVSLPEERAYLFETTVDAHTPLKEMRNILDFRLEENVPISPRDAYFDYVVVGKDLETKAHRVVVAVYAQATINSYYEACKSAGVIPLSFEIEAQAIARATIPKGQMGTYMIVDFGKTRMGVGIVHDGVLMYTSTIEIAGFQMSEDMRKVLGKDIPESEITEIKNTKGLSRTSDNEAVANALIPYAEGIAEELAIRIHYWHTRGTDTDERSIRKIIICGGSVNLNGLPEFLSSKLEIEVERASVWQNAFSLNDYVPQISRRHSYGYATATGLALTGFM